LPIFGRIASTPPNPPAPANPSSECLSPSLRFDHTRRATREPTVQPRDHAPFAPRPPAVPQSPTFETARIAQSCPYQHR
jgi:hypothetical protein